MAKTFLLLIFLFVYGIITAQSRYGVIITEIMCDPTPQVGLPNSEWVELKNVSTTAVNLQGFRLGDGSGLSGPMPSYVLAPGTFVVVSTASAISALSVFGPAISVTSFPSLDNAGELIYLQNAGGAILHAVEYSAAWHDNEVKRDGGYTLEMIDTQNPCTGEGNWRSSRDGSGGTPGRTNSVDGVNRDETPPRLLHSYAEDNQNLILVFDEPLDSGSATAVSKYTISPSVSIASVLVQPPLFKMVRITTTTTLQSSIEYTLKVSGVTDCRGNVIGSQNQVRTGLVADAAPGDLIINEILFNPKPGGNDFVELYNRSEKILDASKLLIANRNSAGALSSFKNLSASPFLIFPGDYVVLTADALNLSTQYFVKEPQQVLPVALPSYPNDKGNVVIADVQGNIIDEVSYSEKWHFALISNRQGISLERISADAASQEPGNWTSAASTVGYATPTYKNSQSSQQGGGAGLVLVSPKVFSPDNDGFDDFTTISYRMDGSGYVANVVILDAAGRVVRRLVQNGTLAHEGSWNWDGLGDKNQKLPVGAYVIFTEIFTPDGKRQSFKNAVILARRVN